MSRFRRLMMLYLWVAVCFVVISGSSIRSRNFERQVNGSVTLECGFKDETGISACLWTRKLPKVNGSSAEVTLFNTSRSSPVSSYQSPRKRDPKVHLRSKLNTCDVVVKDLDLSHSGPWHCQVKTSTGRIEKKEYTLQVYASARLEVEYVHRYERRNITQLVVKCNVDARAAPRPTVTAFIRNQNGKKQYFPPVSSSNEYAFLLHKVDPIFLEHEEETLVGCESFQENRGQVIQGSMEEKAIALPSVIFRSNDTSEKMLFPTSIDYDDVEEESTLSTYLLAIVLLIVTLFVLGLFWVSFTFRDQICSKFPECEAGARNKVQEHWNTLSACITCQCYKSRNYSERKDPCTPISTQAQVKLRQTDPNEERLLEELRRSCSINLGRHRVNVPQTRLYPPSSESSIDVESIETQSSSPGSAQEDNAYEEILTTSRRKDSGFYSNGYAVPLSGSSSSSLKTVIEVCEREERNECDYDTVDFGAPNNELLSHYNSIYLAKPPQEGSESNDS